ncbi:hypothetical protein AGMMS50256_37220 [Betaproteobacteria bacterium]|nr:hypothetical protein AGMMS50256_37220 [Betaproteobacteria bacterium]
MYDAISKRKGSDKSASEYLNSLGIPGLRYLNGNSRSVGEGFHNYVVWDDNAINILETYYSRNDLNRVAGVFDGKTIHLVASNIE